MHAAVQKEGALEAQLAIHHHIAAIKHRSLVQPPAAEGALDKGLLPLPPYKSRVQQKVPFGI
eukprot:CAMPEP_0179463578 /NCGR_PEP_ID=MMETSP0799-20121207/45609_1 /TAXON_ID=46947 /ORGANISM="Geminigera cryophila, Strain CCMP2564" /LENGTH=61 /DNA_ID=CAMNT_0021266931 /DNA_START=895 /DNA_END=1080 /DNA_ORIENTATION=+